MALLAAFAPVDETDPTPASSPSLPLFFPEAATADEDDDDDEEEEEDDSAFSLEILVLLPSKATCRLSIHSEGAARGAVDAAVAAFETADEEKEEASIPVVSFFAAVTTWRSL